MCNGFFWASDNFNVQLYRVNAGGMGCIICDSRNTEEHVQGGGLPI